MLKFKHNPTINNRITYRFGFTKEYGPTFHNGIDLGAVVPGVPGDPVYAVDDGVVLMDRANSPSAGNYVLIGHENYFSRSLHLLKMLVRKGQNVKAGDIIGLMGSTGHSTAAHLHLEIKTGDYKDFWKKNSNGSYINAVDPEEMLILGKQEIFSKTHHNGKVYEFSNKSVVKTKWGQCRGRLWDGIRYMEIDPNNFGLFVANKHKANNLHRTGLHGVNGTFQYLDKKTGLYYHNGLMVIGNKIICRCASRGADWLPKEKQYPQSVLCYYQDNSFGVEVIRTAEELSKPVWFAIGGIGLIGGHGYNPSAEGFRGVFSDVLRHTGFGSQGHTSVGITFDNKIILARSWGTNRKGTIRHMEHLGCKYAVGMDSGGSCQIRTPGWSRPSKYQRAMTALFIATDL